VLARLVGAVTVRGVVPSTGRDLLALFPDGGDGAGVHGLGCVAAEAAVPVRGGVALQERAWSMLSNRCGQLRSQLIVLNNAS
jgi:hypothetical protein